MKKNFDRWAYPRPTLKKLIMELKIAFLLIMLSVSSLFAESTYSQIAKVSLEMENKSLEQVMDEIERQSEFYFIFNQKQIDVGRIVSIQSENQLITAILPELFKGTNVNYAVFDRKILLTTDPLNNRLMALATEEDQQLKKITGTVTDKNGAPLPGVNVYITGTSQGTTTDQNGKYSIDVPDNARSLTFSFVGMEPQIITIGALTMINVTLLESSIGMEEVVVVGYGTQKKVNLTGAVSTVSGNIMTKRRVVNPTTLLQGMLSGVQVIQNTGLPGFDGSSILIRGLGSFGASAAPLVLIDGVPGDMSILNPSSIKSVTVLKDAASAAIYGSRAANGVILVTTYDGSGSPDGKLSVRYSIDYGISTPTNLVEMVHSSPDYMRWFNTFQRNSLYGNTPSYGYSDADIAAYTNPSDPILYPSYDWVKNGVKSGTAVNHDISISGGKQTRYNLVLGYTDQQGEIKNFNAKKYTGQLNIASDIGKNFKAGANIGLFNNSSGTGEGSGDYGYYFSQPPTYMPFVPDGSGRITWRAFIFEQHPWNPYALSQNYLFNRERFNLRTQLWADLKIVEGLHWYTKGSINYGTSNDQNFVGKRLKLYLYRDPDNTSGSYELGDRLKQSIGQTVYKNLYSYLNFEKTFKSVHHINLMGGYSWETEYAQSISGYRTGYISWDTPTLDAGSAGTQSNSGSSSAWGIISGFGRFNYDYAGKYLFEANARYDGTSRMSSDVRWDIFPSFSAGWKFSEERFMESVKSWLSMAKLRVSYGVLGNQNIGTYPYQAMLSFTGDYSFNNSALSQGIAQTRLNNAALAWEVTKTSDLGVDLTFFDKLSLSLDLYDKLTTGILRSAQGTAVLGLTTPTVNKGAMKNTGFDLDIDYRDRIKSGVMKDFSYSIGVVASAFKNKTVTFGTKELGSNYILQEGSPWQEWYMLKAIGIFQSKEEIASSPKQYGENTQPGSLKFEDANKDGVIDDNDRVALGYAGFPDFVYDINGSVEWKNFDFYCSFLGVVGQTGYSQSAYMMQPNLIPTAYQFNNAWTPQNKSNIMVAAGDPLKTRHASTYFLFDRSYLRLKGLQIGYTLPSKLLSKIHIAKIRIYFAADNLLTFTKFMGMDPEGAIGDFPINRIISFGGNFIF